MVQMLLEAACPSCCPTDRVTALEENYTNNLHNAQNVYLLDSFMEIFQSQFINNCLKQITQRNNGTLRSIFYNKTHLTE